MKKRIRILLLVVLMILIAMPSMAFADNKYVFEYEVEGEGCDLVCSIPSGSEVEAGTNVTLTGIPAKGYQFNSIGTNGGADVNIDGNSLSFTMPENMITISAYFTKVIDNISIDFEIPLVGDTNVKEAVVEPQSLFKSCDLIIADADTMEMVTGPFESGKQYLAYFYVIAKDGYSFKYNGGVVQANNSDMYDYGVDVLVNDEIIYSYLNSEEELTRAGYCGTNNIEHDKFSIYYFFTPNQLQKFVNTPIAVASNYEGELKFVTDANYTEDLDVKVKVDDIILDSSKYTLAKGSTHVTLKKDYVKSLNDGKHVITVDVKGYRPISQEFTIGGSPETGVNDSYKLYTAIYMSLFTLLLVLIMKNDVTDN